MEDRNPIKSILLHYTILQNLYFSTCQVAARSGRFHDISMLLSMRDRWDQSEHEDEGDFGKAQPALYPSVGRLPGQQTNMQVRNRSVD